MLLITNLTPHRVTTTIDVPDTEGLTVQQLHGSRAFTCGAAADDLRELVLEPYEFQWLALSGPVASTDIAAA